MMVCILDSIPRVCCLVFQVLLLKVQLQTRTFEVFPNLTFQYYTVSHNRDTKFKHSTMHYCAKTTLTHMHKYRYYKRQG